MSTSGSAISSHAVMFILESFNVEAIFVIQYAILKETFAQDVYIQTH